MFITEDHIISLLIGIAVLMWFKGSYRLLDTFIPNTTINNILCIIVAIVILYIINNGNLYTLGKSTKDDNKKSEDLFRVEPSI